MIRHQAVGIERTIGATAKTIVIILIAHPVKGRDELEVVFLVLKDILVVDAAHHHVEYPCA